MAQNLPSEIWILIFTAGIRDEKPQASQVVSQVSKTWSENYRVAEEKECLSNFQPKQLDQGNFTPFNKILLIRNCIVVNVFVHGPFDLFFLDFPIWA